MIRVGRMLRVALELVEVTEGVGVMDGVAETEGVIVLEGVIELDSEGVTEVADGSSTEDEVVASAGVVSGLGSSLAGAS